MSIAPNSFATLLDELQRTVAVTAVTALRYETDRAQRIFSSDPARFPDHGSKAFADAPTMAEVRRSAQPMLTEGVSALKDGFADWQTIVAQNCEAIVNVPVRLPSGETVGQINLLGRAGAFPESAMPALQTVADRFADCFLHDPFKEVESCASQD